jgi:hypothetical protein
MATKIFPRSGAATKAATNEMMINYNTEADRRQDVEADSA